MTGQNSWASNMKRPLTVGGLVTAWLGLASLPGACGAELGFAASAEAIEKALSRAAHTARTRGFVPASPTIRALKYLGEGQAAEVEVTPTSAAAPAVNLSVEFALDSAQLRPTGQRLLQELAAALQRPTLADKPIALRGHTDSTGAERYNLRLSLRRARAVRDYLVGTARLAAERFTLYGLGEGDPVASNTTPAGRQRNRRVEVIARAAGRAD